MGKKEGDGVGEGHGAALESAVPIRSLAVVRTKRRLRRVENAHPSWLLPIGFAAYDYYSSRREQEEQWLVTEDDLSLSLD